MDDVKVQLQEIKEDHESGKLAAAASGPAVTQKRSRSWRSIAAACVLLAGVAGLLWSLYRRAQPTGFTVPVSTRLTADAGLTFQPSLSPDGKLIAYSSDRGGDGGLDIWVQQLAGGEPIRLTRDPADDQDPSFSPDGSRIVFTSGRGGGGVYIMSALGGAEQKIAEGGVGPRFSPDGKWVAYRIGDRLTGVFVSGAVYVIPSGGGLPRRIAATLPNAIAPVWSPDSKSILVFGSQRTGADRVLDWWVMRLDSGEMSRTGVLAELQSRKLAPAEVSLANQHLVPSANSWTDEHIILSAFSGHVSNIWRLPFSVANGRITGAPERLTAGTALEADASVAGLAGERLLAFSSVLENVDLWSIPMLPDQAKPTGTLQRLTRGLGADVRPSVTSDGSKVVYNSNPSGNWDIWIKDLKTGVDQVLASSETDEENPRIDRSGQQVLYRIDGPKDRTTFIMPAAGGLKRKVAENCNLFPWMADGRRFLCQDSKGLLTVDATSAKRTYVVEGGTTAPASSWDDLWVTFYRNIAGGSTQIFVAPVMADRPARDADLIEITDGKTWDALPEFSPDGRILYFQSERDGARCVWAQRLDPGTKKPAGAAFPVQHFHSAGLSLAHVMPGQRALSVARDKIIVAAAERTGNVWLSRFERW
jgi:eukaryotic-like serine/threonine-protein kinase